MTREGLIGSAKFGAVSLDDEYNQTLINNVHPKDWVNPEPNGKYNLVVIGAGPAGLVTAAIAAVLGAKVALIERHLMGGDCLNVAVLPKWSIWRNGLGFETCICF
jgi:alkyl hydroperoxide reductase subunit AhpF